MFKWIKQFFEKEDEHSAYNALPCVAMQSEIIANELEEKEQNFSEPVNLIVESLKEEGRWTWEFPQKLVSNNTPYYLITDSQTKTQFKVYFMFAETTDCDWATTDENMYMGKAMLDTIREKNKKIAQKQTSIEREKITAMYKEASHAE